MKIHRSLKLLIALVLLAGIWFTSPPTQAREPADEIHVTETAPGMEAYEALRLEEKEKWAAPQPTTEVSPPSAGRQPVSAVLLEENFESWPPLGWTIVNNGGDCVWQSTAETGRPNYAGGDGQAAVADSDYCLPDTTMDTELRTPVIDLAAHGGGTLEFVAAYNWWTGDEYFAVDVSSDGGLSWANLLSWQEDYDPYGPGQLVSLDLSAHLSDSVVVRFHYYAPGWDLYAVVDRVRVLPPMPDLSTSYKSAPGLVVPGQPITYTIVLSNSGNLLATNTRLVDPIPPNTTFARTLAPPSLVYNAGKDQVEWVGTVTDGGSIELTYVVTVSEVIACGLAITNTATITHAQSPAAVTLQHVMQVGDHVYYAADLEASDGGFIPDGNKSSWAWGPPANGPRRAHSGARVWATNLQGSYNHHEDSYLTSPPIDLSNAPAGSGYELWLQWWDWFSSELCCDYGIVQARGGEIDWIPVSSEFHGRLGGWTKHQVDISAFSGASDFQFRFHLYSDPTIASEGWYIDDITIYQCSAPPGLYLSPDGVELSGCVGISQTHTFNLFNWTGADGIFDLTYDLSDQANATIEGPDTRFISDQMATSLVITLTPGLCLPDRLELVATLEATGNGYTDTSYITQTVNAGGPCPVCPDLGWLEGHVYDYNGLDASCTGAAVHIQPGGAGVIVDAGGYYTVSLVPFDYQVTASAADYPEPDGPYPVSVGSGQISPQDFVLHRSNVDITPLSLNATAFTPAAVTRYLTITNQGTYKLDYEIHERPPSVVTNVMSQLRATAGDFRPGSPTDLPAVEVEPELLARLNADNTAGYLIYFRERPDLMPAFEMDWIERGRIVVEALKRTADLAQMRVRAYLDGQGADYKAFWIDNIIVVNQSSLPVFNGLLGFSEIEALRARRRAILHEPVEHGPAGLNLIGIESNIVHIGADRVWSDFGITGQGIVVANIDTGVRYTHEALVNQYRGNLGGGSFQHDYNWWDPDLGGIDLEPTDWHNHGSHTMGIILGDNGAGTQIGVAPGATWIACQAFEAPDDAELLECGQFMAAPWDLTGSNPDPDLRPHIVNNSWGDCLLSADHWYDGVINSWHALGIYPVFSNGNASNCGYPQPPGCNTVGNPARTGNVTAVGSTGLENGQYAPHSNWGPTDDPDTVNPNGFPSLKPQVVAPGIGIRSAYRSSDTVYGPMSGTSMSSPHVAGLVALMWSAAPCLVGDYATTETLIEQTATPIPYASGCVGEGPGDVPNFATGWGEIDAYAAVWAAMDYCRTDWLPWVEADIVSGTLGSAGHQVIQVTFSCTSTATRQIQPLEGDLRIFHNDPCQDPLDVHLVFSCVGKKQIFLPLVVKGY